jgi:hypothetical protein
MATSGTSGAVRLWNTTDPRHPVALGTVPAAGQQSPQSVYLSADGRTLAEWLGTGTT